MNDNTYNYLSDFISDSINRYSLKIHSINHLKVSKDWEIEKNRLNKDQHIILILSGKGEYMLGNQPVELKKGRVIFVSNTSPHSSKTDKMDRAVIIPVRFGIYDRDDNHISNFFDEPFSFYVDFNNLIEIERLFTKLNNEFRKDNYKKEMTNHILMQILIETLREVKKDKNRMEDPLVNKISSYIQSNISKRITLNELSRIFMISKRQLNRKFNIFMEKSPHRYIIERKIENSKFYLVQSDMSIKEIAASLGYADAYSFSKQFRKETGFSPSEYINKYK